MNRKKKFILNTGISLLYQLIAVICGFILPHVMITHYGSGVNGLVSSITQFLGFITMLECGISSVIQSNLYGPLANNDYPGISRIFVSSQKFFRKIAYIFIAYIFVLIFLYPYIINEQADFWFTVTLILIISITSLVQYCFGLTYRIVLNAAQYSYIATSIQCIVLVLNTVLSIVLIRLNASIHVVKLSATLLYLLQPIGVAIFVNRKYKIDRKIKYTEEPIKQKWNGLAQHIAFMATNSTDSIVLTIFTTLENVSIYSVYNLVTSGVSTICNSMTLEISPLLGNMYAKNETKELHQFFDTLEHIWHCFITCIFTITGILIVPFVKVYTKDITDADYIVPLFAIVLVVANGFYLLRTPYSTMVSAAGHYKQTQLSSFIEAGINIVFSVILVSMWGLVGVAIGTLAAMVYRTIYLVVYLSKHILNRPIKYFIYNILFDLICVCFMIGGTFFIAKDVGTYFEWFILAIKVGGICFLVAIVLNLLIYPKKIKNVYKLYIKRK